jgi:hypothetical protein
MKSNQPWAEKAQILRDLRQAVEQHRGGSWTKRKDFEMFVDIESVKTWDEVNTALHSRFSDKRWVFRGQSNAGWRLETSLERSILRRRIEGSGGQSFESYITPHPSNFEQPLLTKFQCRMDKYVSAAPAENEKVEWLALMQHYGAPTRLLDWTTSPYVALYFALEDRKSNENCAVWAIDTDWVDEKSRRALKWQNPKFSDTCSTISLQQYLNDILVNDLNPSVIVVGNPIGMNERRAAQQGTFLFDLGSTIGTTFDITLMRMFYEVPAAPPICKLVISPKESDRIISELTRMNLDHVSLFPACPGLDEISSSIRVQLKEDVDELYRICGWQLA